jgi:hypothetical protein
MLYFLIFLGRIIQGIFYIIHDIIYFILYFKWLLFKPVHIDKWNHPTRIWNVYVRERKKFKNIFYYLIKPIVL